MSNATLAAPPLSGIPTTTTTTTTTSAAAAVTLAAAGLPDLIRETYLLPYTGQTLALYARHVDDWLNWCTTQDLDPLTVTRMHVELYIKHRTHDRGNKPATIGSILTALRGYYRTAVVEEILLRNPVEHARRPKVRDVDRTWLTRMELHRFTLAARDLSPRHDALGHLLAILGLRVSEACALTIPDVRHQVAGHQAARILGKGGTITMAPLPIPVLRAVERAIDGRADGPLLLTLDGRPLARHAATGLVATICRHAALPVVSPHVLRRSVITALLDAGVPLRDVQHFARHARPDTTMIYDRGQSSLDRHAAHIASAFLAS